MTRVPKAPWETGRITAATPLAIEAAQPILIGAEAAADRPAQRCFNGKIEAPSIVGIAAWDFSRRMESMEIEDTGPNALTGPGHSTEYWGHQPRWR